MQVIALNYYNSHLTDLSFRPNIKSFLSAGIVSFFVLMMLHVVQVNLVTTETFLMQESQKKVNELSRENKALEVRFAQLNSLTSLEDKVGGLNFEKIDKVHYIQALDGHLVTNR